MGELRKALSDLQTDAEQKFRGSTDAEEGLEFVHVGSELRASNHQRRRLWGRKTAQNSAATGAHCPTLTSFCRLLTVGKKTKDSSWKNRHWDILAKSVYIDFLWHEKDDTSFSHQACNKHASRA